MNCRLFQNQLYEFVEGSLSDDERAAADQHLSGCSACRQALSKEQQVAQFLSSRFRQDAETLSLPPGIRDRILTSPRRESSPPIIVGLWNRFAWPLGIAASLLLVFAILLIRHFPGARIHDPDSPCAVSVKVSYQAPTHKFRQEGNFVLDTVADQKVFISETLWTKNPIRLKQEKKIPL